MSAANRETWLTQAVEILSAIFKAPPAVRVSVGMPFGRKQREIMIQVQRDTDDGVPQIFINPQVSDGRAVANLLFGQLAALTGESVTFDDSAALVDVLGSYPQAAVRLPDYTKQPTKMIKASCVACGYIIRATAKHLDRGTPLCPCNTLPMQRADHIPF